MTVVRSREAKDDIEAAAIWYEQQREGLGVEFVLELDAVLERVETGPRQFPEIEPRVRRALLRRFPYAVYFVIEEDSVGVFAVLHQSRDPGGVGRLGCSALPKAMELTRLALEPRGRLMSS